MAAPPQDMRQAPLDRWSAALGDGLRRAYADLHRDRGGERFYAAGLAFADEPSVIVVAANSEEGLERVVARYGAHAAGADPDNLAGALRWAQVAEWEYHRYAEPLLAEANALLDAFYSAHKAWVWSFPAEDRPGASLRELDQRVLAVLRDVVRTLDADGVFNGACDRDDVVVNVWSSVGTNPRATLERAAWFNTAEQLIPLRRTLLPPE